MLVKILNNIIDGIKEDMASKLDNVDKYIITRQLEDFRVVLQSVLDEMSEKLDDYESIIRKLEETK